MSIIRIKEKGQMTLPATVREQFGLNNGDLLKVVVKHNNIILTPQSLVDREIAESLDDYSKGRSYGPFASADEMILSLKRNLKKGAKDSQRV